MQGFFIYIFYKILHSLLLVSKLTPQKKYDLRSLKN